MGAPMDQKGENVSNYKESETTTKKKWIKK